MTQLRLPIDTKMKSAAPILKWAGGKTRLLTQIKPYFPQKDSYKRYFEPFLGGAAVYFFLQPDESFLFDLNPHLIEVYKVVRDNVDELIVALQQHHNDEEYFYKIRAQTPKDLSEVQRAARIIYLNKTCYNGLYRVNQQDQFNVPFGYYKKPNICDIEGLKAAHVALQSARLEVADFNVVLDRAMRGDLVYFDPPYEPLSSTSSFTSYTSAGFDSNDQRRLADVYRALDARGCFLLLSNSSAPLISELYQDFHIHEINAQRAINSKGDGRGLVKEYLITNFNIPS